MIALTSSHGDGFSQTGSKNAGSVPQYSDTAHIAIPGERANSLFLRSESSKKPKQKKLLTNIEARGKWLFLPPRVYIYQLALSFQSW